MSLAVGSIAHLMTRSLYAVLNSRNYWYQSLHVTPGWAGDPVAIRVMYNDASACLLIQSVTCNGRRLQSFPIAFYFVFHSQTNLFTSQVLIKCWMLIITLSAYNRTPKSMKLGT